MAPLIRAYALFLVASLAVLVTAFPSEGNEWKRESNNLPSRADEVVIVPLENSNKATAQDSDEDDYGEEPEGYGSSSQWTSSFGSFYQGMQAMMWQLRNQMQEILRRIPQESLDPSNGSSMMVVPSWDSLPGNATSTTKVINGHIVTVNETTYKQGSDGSSAVFHVRVVDIKPQQSSTKNEEGHEEVETVEESVGSNPSSSLSSRDAELPSPTFRWLSRARRPSLPSPLGHVESKHLLKKPVSRRVFHPQTEEVPDSMNRIDDAVEVFERENEVGRANSHVVDLSRDTLVNKLMSDQQRKGGLIALHPDVELLEIADGKVVGASEDFYLQKKLQEPAIQQPV